MADRLEKYYDLETQRIEYMKKDLELHHKEMKRKALIRLAIGCFLGIVVFVCLFLLFTSEVPAGNRDVLISLVSGLTGAFFGSVVSYYFGDSDSRPDSKTQFEVPAPDFSKYKEPKSPENSTSTEEVPKVEEPKYETGLKKE